MKLLPSSFRTRSAKIGIGMVVIFSILIIVGPFLTPYSPTENTSSRNSPPSLAHPFGTDNVGHDLMSQIFWGAYPSMVVGLFSAIGAVGIGLLAGVLAGYYRKTEGLLMGVGDVILTFPPVPLMILLGSFYPASSLLLIAIMTVVLWPVVARSIRSQVLSIKEMPFVESSRTSGMRNFEIISRIIIPEVGSLAVAYFVLAVSSATVLVTTLQFLGVGNPNEVSWGSILYWAQQYGFYAGDWWWVFVPGLFITLITTAFAVLGFSVEEIMNPRLRTY